MAKLVKRIAQESLGPAVLLGLVIAMLHRALFSGGKLVAALADTDLHMQYLGWRWFGFSHWKQGILPLWDPRVFCGIPFFAQLQSTMLYPITWIHFIVNTGEGCNIELAASIFMAGLFMYCWCRQRRLSRWAATMAGALFMFSGPVFLHLMAGHVTPMAAMAWAPLIFLSVDRLLERKYRSGFVIGTISVCLQLLAGYPQYAYYTAICAGLYLLLQITRRPEAEISNFKFQIADSPQPNPLQLGNAHQGAEYRERGQKESETSNFKFQIWRPVIWFIAMYVGGALLAAAQLIPAYQATQLSIRAGGTTYQFSSTLSLPPENLLSLIIPYPMGDSNHVAYAGRWYLWETSLYTGVVALALACIGLVSLRKGQRWRMALLLLAMLLLALGSYTPVHHFLYKYLPGFDLFRGASKFSLLVALLISVLAAHGWDRVRISGSPKAAVAAIVLVAALCVAGTIYLLQVNPQTGPVARLMRHIDQSGQYFVNYKSYLDLHHEAVLSQWIARQFLLCAVLLLATAGLLYLRRVWRKSAYVLLALAVAEVLLAAVDANPISPLRTPYPRAWAQATAIASAHDQRLLNANMGFNNMGFLVNADFLWGYDPAVPRRYAQFIAYSQDEHPREIGQYYLNLKRVSRMFRLLRCRYVLVSNPKHPVLSVSNPLPHLQLVGSYIKLSKPDDILAKLDQKDFPYRQSVVLEQNPSIRPSPLGATGDVHLVHHTINDLEIEADLPAPAILLVTDRYAPGWTVRPLERNPHQSHYQVLRADYVLRAIPLAAGHHHFVLSYRPRSVVIGFIVSLIALCGFFALIGYWLYAVRPTRVRRQIASPFQPVRSDNQ